MLSRTTIAALAVSALCLAAPAASIAAPTQTFDAGAELLNQPKNSPWELKFFVGASFGTDDGSPVSAVRKMVMSFPTGATFRGDAFKTCTQAKAETGDCPASTLLGTGTATAMLGKDPIDATIKVYNGPGNANKRSLYFYSKAVGIPFTLIGVMRKTSGQFGYVLEVTVPPIVPELVEGGVAITSFDTTIGGAGRVKGKRVPLLTAPTSCKGGWKFQAVFSYANGSSGTVKSAIPCRLAATKTS